MSLARKKNIDNAEWIETFQHIEEKISKEQIDKLSKETIKAIKKTVKGKKVTYGWSGGKDSLVLADLCEKAGVKKSLFVHSELEYPQFLKWCLNNKPVNCEVFNVGLDLEWLSKHKELMFPQNCRTAYRWYQLVQQTGIKKYFKANGLDMFLVGHRSADGNYTGKDNISKNSAGVVRYAPIANWSHEELLAYIHYNKIPLPPIYYWENGFKCGTHPWPSRTHTAGIEDGFEAVYTIDRSIVKEAAKYIEEAAHFLEKKEVRK